MHTRTFDTQDLRSITSIVHAPAITRLGALGMIEAGSSGPGALFRNAAWRWRLAPAAVPSRARPR